MIGNSIRSYFRNATLEEWKFKYFKRFLDLLGYKDIDTITRNYIRFLKDISNNDVDEKKRTLAIELIKKAENREVDEVKIIIIINLFEPGIHDDIVISIYCPVYDKQPLVISRADPIK